MGHKKTDAAVEAIKFALKTDCSMEFLRAWLHGDFDVIRRDWPECPEGVFVGADPTLGLYTGTSARRRESTTDLPKIQDGAPFTWGQSIQLHEVGSYSILEFHPWKSEGSTILSGQPDLTERRFFAWVDQKCTAHTFLTLDAALAGCIAYRHEGSNHRADDYFMKMVTSASAQD